tara:strand:- start:506 stop:700 length:195 start_codon:yes stop_codon:yes gene_type:complete
MATKGRTKTTQTPCGKFKKGSSKHTKCMAKIVGKAAVSGALAGAAIEGGKKIGEAGKKVINKDK